jgi:hypothetical protein
LPSAICSAWSSSFSRKLPTFCNQRDMIDCKHWKLNPLAVCHPQECRPPNAGIYQNRPQYSAAQVLFWRQSTLSTLRFRNIPYTMRQKTRRRKTTLTGGLTQVHVVVALSTPHRRLK